MSVSFRITSQVGTGICVGVASADALLMQDPGVDAESRMHGAIPRGRGYYHVTVAPFDRETTRGLPIGSKRRLPRPVETKFEFRQ